MPYKAAKCQLIYKGFGLKIIIHQTHHKIADFKSIFKYLEENFKKPEKGIHIFPELFLTGYPLLDLCLQKPFVAKYQAFLEKLIHWSHSLPKDVYLLMGGLEYNLTQSGIPMTIKNVVFGVSNSFQGESLYAKKLLPNYDIFDEKKYFTKGREPQVIEVFDKKIGLLICEDMWASSFHDIDPVDDLQKFCQSREIQLDAVVNLSASPFIINKHKSRLERAVEISCLFQCPFIYVNRVGGEDEILFDGRSFAVDGERKLFEGKKFRGDILELDFPEKSQQYSTKPNSKSLTWEELFQARLNEEVQPAILRKWNNHECQEVLEALAFGFQEYASKNGFQKFTIALSGGMDSAMVLTIIKLSLKKGQSVEAIYMPSIHSSSLSYDLCFDLCQRLGVKLTTMPIKFLHSAAKNLFGQSFNDPFKGLSDENIQSRLRGVLLYGRTNQVNSMAVNTSNKSELAVGYSTQYGDSVGAISLLGDLYKSEVYALAHYINEFYQEPIPPKLIHRPPTAELRADQKDEDSLPPYAILDAILEGILSYRYSKEDLLQKGFDQEDIDKVFTLYARSEYKRYQFCPIIKISSKSFGFGYRIPLSSDKTFYNQSDQ
ncbi:MAG: NAD(+) synthase [Halobacteriovoraceae bacterium]|nr:NAD(+) synthase [Halobacteriovoraceae bacterium]|tara:strand:- start:17633 stop:19435 length:1803 start_codon:yes stop_codon:yes gene_type:complete